ncbi:hypothetical protein B0H15DRAFT_792003 [Mycena belliarum]|uniref:F-box domain-containing protein n=1 Tax=Mycena belliarum TaxID=1033014 RepID=A0AAD6XMB2_9AGAR|nr:hypothetical protein B0H15DRAFT_792003 [Mycena belliae]
MPDLPSELWTQIFDLAADEALILQHRLPTSMSGLKHFQNNLSGFPAESLQDELNRVQRRSYRTKKAVVLTCKKWRALEHQSLFSFLYFRAPSCLCNILDTSAAAATTAAASLGWWTRRIHLASINNDKAMLPEDLAVLHNALVRILRRCPNLESLVVQWPLDGEAFGAIVDALVRHAASSLRTLFVTIPASALHKLVTILPVLPSICALHIELTTRVRERHLPTPDGPDDRLRLPNLQQLSLSGRPQQLIHVAKHWHLPALRTFSLFCDTHTEAHLPATPAFLAAHGAQLTALELFSKPAMPLACMLAACPALTTLSFNGDWALDLPSDAGAPPDTPPFAHARLARVGLHGLTHAFYLRPVFAGRSEAEREAARMNERALALLCDRARFPALRRVRVLSGDVVRERERAQGDGGGTAQRSARTWARWDGMLAHAEIQLEDYSGEVLPPWPGVSTDRHDDEVKQAGD